MIIKTDQKSLQYLSSQRLLEGIQHKLMLKLLEFDYSIEYKKGIENSVADALSRKYQDDDSESHPLPTTATCSAISVAVPSWLEDVHASYKDDAHCNKLL